MQRLTLTAIAIVLTAGLACDPVPKQKAAHEKQGDARAPNASAADQRIIPVAQLAKELEASVNEFKKNYFLEELTVSGEVFRVSGSGGVTIVHIVAEVTAETTPLGGARCNMGSLTKPDPPPKRGDKIIVRGTIGNPMGFIRIGLCELVQ